MRILTSGLALAAAIAATGFTTGRAAAYDARQTQRIEGRPVMICSQDAATRRAFAREHGAAPIFVTARQALNMRRSDTPWTSPRCMTEREHGLYREQIQTFAVVR